jgi:charged multivesicular body protein 1
MQVQSDYVETAMGQSTAVSTPAEDVDSLISQVAEEHGLHVQESLEAAPTASTATAEASTAQVAEAEQDELASRLAALRANT